MSIVDPRKFASGIPVIPDSTTGEKPAQPFLPFDHVVHGRCSLCGGIVSTPKIFYSINAPVPTCNTCGATSHPPGYESLPVLPMKPPSY